MCVIHVKKFLNLFLCILSYEATVRGVHTSPRVYWWNLATISRPSSRFWKKKYIYNILLLLFKILKLKKLKKNEWCWRGWGGVENEAWAVKTGKKKCCCCFFFFFLNPFEIFEFCFVRYYFFFLCVFSSWSSRIIRMRRKPACRSVFGRKYISFQDVCGEFCHCDVPEFPSKHFSGFFFFW